MYFVFGLMCLLFGTTFLAIKIGIEAGAPPFLFAGTRFFFAGIVVLTAAVLLGKSILVKSQDRRDVLQVGLFMTGIMFGCLYWGERYISSSIAALLAATTPLMVCIAEMGTGGQRTHLGQGLRTVDFIYWCWRGCAACFGGRSDNRGITWRFGHFDR